MLIKETYSKELQELLTLSQEMLAHLDNETLVPLAVLLQEKLKEVGEFNIESPQLAAEG